jgi:hypothetical protein
MIQKLVLNVYCVCVCVVVGDACMCVCVCVCILDVTSLGCGAVGFTRE